MEQLEQVRNGENGNTKERSFSRKYRRWFFTLNNYSEEDINMLRDSGFDKYVFQCEVGTEKGTPHLQGYFEVKNPRCMSGLKNDLGKKIHLEVCRNKAASVAYCQKINTSTGRVFRKGFPEPVKTIQNLYPWQEEVVKLCDTVPDDRTIHWYYDDEGKTGKTALAKFLVLRKDALYVTGKCSDVKYGVTQWLEDHDEIKIIIWYYT